MSLKFRLTAIIFAILTVVMATLLIITLANSRSLQQETAYLYTDALAGEASTGIGRRIDSYTAYGRILS